LKLICEQALVKDLAETLFPVGSSEADRMRIQVVRSKHLVITGGRWKYKVMEWLAHKGF
jgi:large subunit ribosomal protein L49